MNVYHAANTTNLHVHGLHVSPFKATDGRDSDNIFLNVLPVGQQLPPYCSMDQIREGGTRFNFQLPDDHPSGTFWYHAHKHGSTAQQVGNGLVGPLIVEDKPGVMPSYIANAPEDILLIQLRGLTQDTPAPSDSGGTPQLVLVDPAGTGGGTRNPTITMAPGEVRRWRIINAAPRADTFVSLNLTDVDGDEALEVYQIAFDGITYERRIEVDTKNNGAPWENPAALAPGNRTDFMVRVPSDAKAGNFRLTALQVPGDVLHGVQAMSRAASQQASEEMSLNIVIAGDPVQDEWSEDPTLPGGGPLTAPIEENEIVKERSVDFYLNLDTTPIDHTIDGQRFDNEVKQTMKLDMAERWTVTNQNTFTHPFHIHVNPFFVTHLNGVDLAALPDDDPRKPLMRWQDTMAIPVAAKNGVPPPGSFTMVSRFVKFTGQYVIHCHILEHEDLGMMQKVEVVA
jgi:FtsP/CotA-like multicopper oxidase with cupredoxin domain